MASLEGQQLALGNLGKIGSHSFANQPEKLQEFVEKYIDLSKASRTVAYDAHIWLGEILSSKGQFEEGAQEFFRAMADKAIENKEKEDAIISYGMATGNQTWQGKQSELKE